MQSKSVTGLVLALLTFGLIVSAALLSSTPQVAAAPPLVITATAEPPTPTTPPAVTPTTPPTVTPTTPPEPPPPATPTTPAPPPDPPSAPAPPAVADPAVAKSVDRAVVALGELLRFTITVTNQGNTAAIGVIVEDTLPSYLEYVSASVERGQVVTSGPTVGFWIGRVEPGEVIRGEIVARMVSFPPAV